MWFLLIFDCFIPLIMIICGRFMWKHYSKEINGFIGYRTNWSMKNMDTWKFAHEYIGQLWWKLGWILLVLTILVHIPFYSWIHLSLVILVVHSICMIGSILLTEKALKENEESSK